MRKRLRSADDPFEHRSGKPAGLGVVAAAVIGIDQMHASSQEVFAAVRKGELPCLQGARQQHRVARDVPKIMPPSATSAIATPWAKRRLQHLAKGRPCQRRARCLRRNSAAACRSSGHCWRKDYGSVARITLYDLENGFSIPRVKTPGLQIVLLLDQAHAR